jgi:putative DNA-invertase from lambdoid prophage Rac
MPGHPRSPCWTCRVHTYDLPPLVDPDTVRPDPQTPHAGSSIPDGVARGRGPRTCTPWISRLCHTTSSNDSDATVDAYPLHESTAAASQPPLKIRLSKRQWTSGRSRPVIGSTMSVGISENSRVARESIRHQQTIPVQLRQMREYVARRGWYVAMTSEEVQSGAKQRREREAVMTAACRRDIDVVLVWRLDRWGRSLSDLVGTLKELQELGVAFVSLTEAFDLTTPTGRAMAGMIAVFAEFEREIRRERVLAGIEQARREGRHLWRPRSAALKAR